MKPFRDWNFATKINSILLLFLLIIGGSVGGFLYFRARAILSEEINKTSMAVVELAAARINRVFPPIESAAELLGLSLEATNPNEKTQKQLLRETLGRLRKSVPSLCGISIAYIPYGKDPASRYFMLYAYVGKSGDIEVARIGNDEYQYFKFDWFTIPQLLNRPIWTEPYLDVYAGIEMSTRSQPIHNSDGKFIGVTGFDLSLEGLSDLVSKADAYGYGQEFLISRFGRFVAFPEEENDPNITPDLKLDYPLIIDSTIFSYSDLLRRKMFNPEDASEKLRSIGHAMLDGKTGHTRGRIFNRQTGMERIFYSAVDAPGWSIGVAYPEVRLLAPLRELTRRGIPVAVAGVALCLLLIGTLIRRISKPLEKLTDAAQLIGSGNFDAPLPSPRGLDQIGRLAMAFQAMQTALKSYIEVIKATTATRQRIESELAVAREIQLGILPKMLPPLPDAEEFSLYATLRPARQVGGDLYDFFYLDKTHYAFIIGDVSGKGIPAALFMAVTQTLQRSEAEKLHDPGELVTRINELLSRNNETLMFVTYFLGILDIATGEVRYTNAGHNPPYIRRKETGAIELLTTRHGPALGTVPDATYGTGSIKLNSGDTIILYTDGITEAENPAHELFGADALLRVLSFCSHATAVQLGEAILQAVDRFASGAEQSDDITMLILRLNELKK
ncbi:MAG: SpoIIE family protein phosphatase [Victivallales bacterium]|jgi:sigma-B regulation protein RsbU (phosphoserine phosphatase)|nr:SpoIIE family protein phosphatase [Victivallales bacterium]